MRKKSEENAMTEVHIRTADIQLNQFLKLAGAVATGGEVRHLLAEGRLKVNDRVEIARRRKLFLGDRVTFVTDQGEDVYRVAGKE